MAHDSSPRGATRWAEDRDKEELSIHKYNVVPELAAAATSALLMSTARPVMPLQSGHRAQVLASLRGALEYTPQNQPPFFSSRPRWPEDMIGQAGCYRSGLAGQTVTPKGG